MRRGATRALVAVGVLVIAGCGSTPAAGPPPAAPPAEPRVLHVEPRGDDRGTGTTGDPFGSLQTALQALRAGDVLRVSGGTYTERVHVDAAPGRPDAPVVVEPAPGERPLLRGLLWLTGPSHWRVRGLDVTWDDATGQPDEHMVKITDGERWELTDAEIWGARSFAAVLVVGEPVGFALRRLHVHDTRPANGTNEDHLLYLKSGTGGGVVEDCLLVGSPNGRAVKIGPARDDGPAVEGVVVRRSTMRDNLGPSNVQLAWTASDNLVEDNVMVGAAPGRANVTAFELSGGGNVVRGNIGWGSTGVVEEADGLVDGGGNLHLDPRLDAAGVAREPRAAGRGRTSS